jgi:alkylated DNA repair dioxygenase AlkB
MQIDLFNPNSAKDSKGHSHGNDVSILAKVKGLKYVPEYISKDEEEFLIKTISSNEWITDLKRRVQHYGWRYDYKARTVLPSMYLGPLPNWAGDIANRLYNDGHIQIIPDQVIVNEYNPGQGIANHIDCEPCFGDTIISVSLNSTCVMDFINIETKEKVEVLLEPRSLVVVSGLSRKIWTHGISARKVDIFRGQRLERKLRISLTYREVIIN